VLSLPSIQKAIPSGTSCRPASHIVPHYSASLCQLIGAQYTPSLLLTSTGIEWWSMQKKFSFVAYRSFSICLLICLVQPQLWCVPGSLVSTRDSMQADSLVHPTSGENPIGYQSSFPSNISFLGRLESLWLLKRCGDYSAYISALARSW